MITPIYFLIGFLIAEICDRCNRKNDIEFSLWLWTTAMVLWPIIVFIVWPFGFLRGFFRGNKK